MPTFVFRVNIDFVEVGITVVPRSSETVPSLVSLVLLSHLTHHSNFFLPWAQIIDSSRSVFFVSQTERRGKGEGLSFYPLPFSLSLPNNGLSWSGTRH